MHTKIRTQSTTLEIAVVFVIVFGSGLIGKPSLRRSLTLILRTRCGELPRLRHGLELYRLKRMSHA
ncbi:MAG: hypothetical protein IJ191_06065 [Treponema sp.]|nr:hypothetical protein [Treponema sp.]